MYDKIWLMVPTYKRVEWIDRFIQSAMEMADHHSNISFCFCVNHKDKATFDFIKNYDFKMIDNMVIEEKSI